MNGSTAASRSRLMLVQPLALAVALALPTAGALAESMSDVVTTRAHQNIDQHYGRDSIYAFSNAPLQPQQTSAGPSPLAKVWDKTEGAAIAAWDKTRAIAATPPNVPVSEPQRYGRAGGFIGVEQFEVPQPGVTTFASAPSNAEAVKSGELQWGYSADARTNREMQREEIANTGDSDHQQSFGLSQDTAEQNKTAANPVQSTPSSDPSIAIIPDHTPMDELRTGAAASNTPADSDQDSALSDNEGRSSHVEPNDQIR